MLSFAIIIIPNSLLERTLPLWLYSVHREIIWPCPPVKGYNKKKRLTYPFQRLALPRDVLQDLRPFFFTSSLLLPRFCLQTLGPHCFSPSGSIKKKNGIQAPTRWLFWDINLPSSQSAGFLNKALFVASTPYFSDLLASHVVNRVSLNSVTKTWYCGHDETGNAGVWFCLRNGEVSGFEPSDCYDLMGLLPGLRTGSW